MEPRRPHWALQTLIALAILLPIAIGLCERLHILQPRERRTLLLCAAEFVLVAVISIVALLLKRRRPRSDVEDERSR